MGWFGFGKKADKAPPPAAPTTGTLDDVDSHQMVTDAPPPTLQIQQPGELLNGDLSQLSGFGAAPTIRYNPYEGLPSTLDPGLLEKMYNLPEAPEFLFQEESRVHRRGWGENITFCTGITYFGGGLVGGGYGALAGLRSAPAGGAIDTTKLKANRVMNAMTNRGLFLGNNLGCLGLLYAGMDNLISWQRGKDDVLNTTLAGASAGLLYKATSGPRAMLVYSSAAAVVCGTLGTAHALYNGRPIYQWY
mmetsp:Transcript_3848/g.7954  ORF Transcript_3848/g.7954 Transcript_3848/m.7954 type:complete len:247 (-) Transcript_3848:248-988(-)|eukprot:CAMPEP_0118933066 /NCGR_PEP_ID=MMETSP1169-20130426/11173_1 /TAXON_ID=36882 /ORGANISM="Pyramimonas obovata, Strain CCMP722" /LENGTH=246 /DNA_ID=CAMNT_0006875787 /DNA_START=288 /DNA_END=1028 /DNA_ORIENTATION=+